MKDRTARQELAKAIPWVTWHRKPTACTGFMNRTPLKALYPMGGKPAVGLDNYRCKNPARWRYRALKRSTANDGDYCWAHLVSRGLYGSMDEEKRTGLWLERHKA